MCIFCLLTLSIYSCIILETDRFSCMNGGDMKKALMIALALGIVVPIFAGQLDVTNDTYSQVIESVYIRDAGSGDWGSNYLASGENIMAGCSKTFNIADGNYDIKIVCNNNTQAIRFGVDESEDWDLIDAELN